MRRGVAGLAAALLILSGCSTGREPDRMALVRVLGVDSGENTVLTAVCGGDQRGLALGSGFKEARERIPWSGESQELSLTGVSYLVIGGDVELTELLISVLEDAELGGTATVWVAKNGSTALLGACKDPTTDLELLTLQEVDAPTVAQAAAALTRGQKVKLPMIDVWNEHVIERGAIWWSEDS